MMKTKFPEVTWPVEYRTLKADNILISSASGRDTVTISVHQDAAIDPAPLFDAAEEMLNQGTFGWTQNMASGAKIAKLLGD